LVLRGAKRLVAVRTNLILEKAFAQQADDITVLIAGALYTVDFRNKCQFKQNAQSKKRKIKRAKAKDIQSRKGMVGIPTSTSNNEMPEIARLDLNESSTRQTRAQSSNQDYYLTDLDTSSDIYKSVEYRMKNTIRHDSTKYEFIKIQKVKNTTLWKSYEKRRKEVENEIDTANERKLFHGSPNANTITKDGFDVSHASTGGMFGPGIYFAEHSSKSNLYVNSDARQMLLCRVTLGNIFVPTTSKKMNNPPSGYHSVKGQQGNGGLHYPEYIIYNNYQAYPEFLVTYRIQP